MLVFLCTTVLFASGATHRPQWQAMPDHVVMSVLNPRQTGGHRLLALDDLIGPKRRRDIAGLPEPAGILILALPKAGCAEPFESWCVQAQAFSLAARALGGVVLGLVLGDGSVKTPEKLNRWPIVLDEYGLVAHRLGGLNPGDGLMIRSDAMMAHWPLENLGRQGEHWSRLVRKFRAILPNGDRVSLGGNFP